MSNALIHFACAAIAMQIQSFAAEQTVYKTPDELRRAAEPLLQPFKAKNRRPDPDDDRLFLVDYLGTADDALRNTAVDVLAKCRRPIRGSAFRKFLAPDYPMNVRVIALAYVVANAWGENDVDLIRSEQLLEKLKQSLATMLKDLAEYPVAPVHLEVLARVMGRHTSLSSRFLELASEEEQRVIFKRFAAVGAGIQNELDSGEIQTCLRLFRVDVFTSELSALYSFSPVNFRSFIADVAARAAIMTGYEKKKLQPLLALIAKDWDSAIASKVKGAMAQVRREKAADSRR
jgi:hypothetical protein